MQFLLPSILVIVAGVLQIVVRQADQTTSAAYNAPLPAPLLSFQSQGMYFLSSNPFNITDVGECTIDGNRSGLLGQFNQRRFGSNSTDQFNPFFLEIPLANLTEEIVRLKLEYAEKIAAGEDRTFIMPPAALVFNSLNASISQLNLTVLYEQQYGYNNLDGMDPDIWIASSLNSIINAFLRFVSQDPNVGITMDMMQLPYKNTLFQFDLGSKLAGILYPFCLSFLLPMFMYPLVLEKQEKLREMMRMMGLSMWMYWSSVYLYDMAIYLITLAVVIAISVAFRFAIFTQGSWLALALLFFGWGNALIALAFFLSALFSRSRTATIFAYLLVIVGVVVSFALNETVFAHQPPLFYYLYPPFAFYRAMLVLGQRCSISQCPKWHEIVHTRETLTVILALYLEAVVLFIASAYETSYLDAVLPRDFGVAKRPLFFLTAFRRRKSEHAFGLEDDAAPNRNALLSPAVPSERDRLLPPERTVSPFGMEDADVAIERQRVRQGQYSAVRVAVLARDLTKRFGRSTLALDKLCLSIERGECFGLLGPNGAGKSTLISLLTGLFPPSSGFAAVGNYDIRADMDRIHQIIGFCPQFDTLWGNLTPLETLLFYARLKGVPDAHQDEHVNQTLELVGLSAVAKQLVAYLSGGMRRRLSVAIALIGQPEIIFLDEPTTGLDPESRRIIWELLAKVKEDRVLILTTHSMEEADFLCSRIGILVGGTLKCLGPPMHLKAKFGSGYTLKINFELRHEEQALRFIEEILPSATLIENFSGCCTYTLPKMGLKLSALFLQMETQGKSAGVTDWSINQSSLEDVFMRIMAAEA